VVARLDPPTWILSAGVASLAAIVGALAGFDPRIAIAVSLALALGLLTIANLTWGLVGFVILSFLELIPNLGGPMLSLAKLAGAVLALSWLAGVASGQYRRLFPSVHPYLTFALITFLAWNALSIAWAEDPGRVYGQTLSFLLSFMLFPIVYSAVSSTRDARMLVLAFVGVATVTSLYGVLAQPDASALATSPAAASGLNRLAGTVGDPNELAALLVAGVALSGAIVFNPSINAPIRVATSFGSLLMLLGVFFTLSRGGLIALIALVVTTILVAGRYRARAVLAGGAVLVATAFFFGVVATPEARDRITVADGGSGRTDIWQVGWRMVEDEPITGAGAANFQVSSIHYLLAPGAIRSDEHLVDAPSVVHNSYLQVLTETGVPGLTLFAIILLACLGAGIRARRNFTRRDDREGELLAIAVVVATVSTLAAFFFLSEESSKHLWLMLSLGPALLGVSVLGRDRGDA
jgi:putative inorganic carbon (HCO3(-)) transporter